MKEFVFKGFFRTVCSDGVAIVQNANRTKAPFRFSFRALRVQSFIVNQKKIRDINPPGYLTLSRKSMFTAIPENEKGTPIDKGLRGARNASPLTGNPTSQVQSPSLGSVNFYPGAIFFTKLTHGTYPLEGDQRIYTPARAASGNAEAPAPDFFAAPQTGKQIGFASGTGSRATGNFRPQQRIIDTCSIVRTSLPRNNEIQLPEVLPCWKKCMVLSIKTNSNGNISEVFGI
jgi:hypothetical protein